MFGILQGHDMVKELANILCLLTFFCLLRFLPS
jgi:hypothetical protein